MRKSIVNSASQSWILAFGFGLPRLEKKILTIIRRSQRRSTRLRPCTIALDLKLIRILLKPCVTTIIFFIRRSESIEKLCCTFRWLDFFPLFLSLPKETFCSLGNVKECEWVRLIPLICLNSQWIIMQHRYSLIIPRRVSERAATFILALMYNFYIGN